MPEVRENKMGVLPVKRLIISMSLPMMVSMLVQALYNIVDSIFVSQINEQALTAVSLAFPLQSLMIAVGRYSLSFWGCSCRNRFSGRRHRHSPLSRMGRPTCASSALCLSD